LARLALLATLAGVIPNIVHVLRVSWVVRRSEDQSELQSNEQLGEETIAKLQSASKEEAPPTLNLLLLSLFNASMAFFLFSFQVHEKSILLPLLPLTLIMSGREDIGTDSGVWEWSVLVNNVAVFRYFDVKVHSFER
jgi:alpha-1,3-glucosyltransferase